MEQKRSHIHGLWIAVAISIAAALIYIGALVLLARSQKALALQTTTLTEEIRAEESARTLSALLRDLSGHTAKLDAFFINPDEAVRVIENIEALSSVAGAPVMVADVHMQDQDAETGEGTLTMNITSSGSWGSMAHLIVLLDTLPFQGELSSATLTLGEDDGTADPQWSFQGLLAVSLRR